MPKDICRWCLQHQKRLTEQFAAPQGNALPQRASSSSCPVSLGGLLGKATLNLLGLGMEDLGAFSELRLTLVATAPLNKPPLWSDRDGRAPFLWRACRCRKCFVRITLYCKGWPIRSLSEDRWVLSGGGDMTTVASSACIPPSGSLLTSEDHYSIYHSNKPSKWYQLKSLDFQRTTGNLNISVNVYYQLVKGRSAQCFLNVEEAPSTHTLNKNVCLLVSQIGCIMLIGYYSENITGE